MMSRNLSRRRFIGIVGIAAGVGMAGWVGRPKALPRPIQWSGEAMGAKAAITLYHSDPDEARRILALCQQEVEQVEQHFSLFRRDSILVRLNSQGSVGQAPPMFLDLAAQARRFSELSDGAFDVTVQPLWDLYAGHFAKDQPDPNGPPQSEIDAARSLVDWRDLTIDQDRVAFARPGMAATFNGIAQGYATDRVAEVMRAQGIANVLLDVGEMRAMGQHADGRPWQVGIADPLAPDTIMRTVELHRAMASSGGYGTVFDQDGRFHHLFDPHSGRPWSNWRGVTVMADTATVADALTKAIALAPLDRAREILRDGGGNQAILVAQDGAQHELTV